MILDEIGENHFFMKIFKKMTDSFDEDRNQPGIKSNLNFNSTTDSESSNISLVGGIKKLKTIA